MFIHFQALCEANWEPLGLGEPGRSLGISKTYDLQVIRSLKGMELTLYPPDLCRGRDALAPKGQVKCPSATLARLDAIRLVEQGSRC